MIHIVGFGPGDWDRTPPHSRELALDHRVVARTRRHPAAATLAGLCDVVFCDDLYEKYETFGEVYAAIAERVLAGASSDTVVYAVPGSPSMGEFAVGEILARAAELGIATEVHPAESFVDAVLAAVGVDPLREGLKVLNGHDLPDPLVFDVPTIIAHVDLPEVLADMMAGLDRLVPEDTLVCVLSNLGSSDASMVWSRPTEVDPSLAGVRTSVFVPAVSGGLLGAVHVMEELRRQCPWDRKQTHHSLVRYLLEESHELADAVASLPTSGEVDFGAYADVEEELGDVLLQVLFHAVIAKEVGAFDVGDVAEQLRRKLVRRHPHVFGDVQADDAEAVKANWDQIKAAEKPDRDNPSSVFEHIPTSLPGLARAAEVQRRAAKSGFDWTDVEPVLAKLAEEIGELSDALGDPLAVAHELGDVLFSVVNLARHLDLDPEVIVRSATQRFEQRFSGMEAIGPLEGLTLDQLDRRWDEVKRLPG